MEQKIKCQQLINEKSEQIFTNGLCGKLCFQNLQRIHQVPLWAGRGLRWNYWTHHFLFFFVLHLRIDVEAWDLPWGKIYNEAGDKEKQPNWNKGSKDAAWGPGDWYAMYNHPIICIWNQTTLPVYIITLFLCLSDNTCKPICIQISVYTTFGSDKVCQFEVLLFLISNLDDPMCPLSMKLHLGEETSFNISERSAVRVQIIDGCWMLNWHFFHKDWPDKRKKYHPTANSPLGSTRFAGVNIKLSALFAALWQLLFTELSGFQYPLATFHHLLICFSMKSTYFLNTLPFEFVDDKYS